MTQLMAALRTAPLAEIAGYAVTEIDDVATGTRRHADGHVEKLGLPPSDVLVWRLRGKGPGGCQTERDRAETEGLPPSRGPVGPAGDVPAATAAAARQLHRLKADLVPLLEPK